MATKVFALELGPHNIRVNSVAPTICSNTVMVQMLPEEVRNALLSHIPMGSMTELKDIVQCVLFLLSDKSRMITGTTLTIDGGHSCYLPV